MVRSWPYFLSVVTDRNFLQGGYCSTHFNHGNCFSLKYFLKGAVKVKFNLMHLTTNQVVFFINDTNPLLP